MTKLIHFFATIVYFNINSLILSDYILLKAASSAYGQRYGGLARENYGAYRGAARELLRTFYRKLRYGKSCCIGKSKGWCG